MKRRQAVLARILAAALVLSTAVTTSGVQVYADELAGKDVVEQAAGEEGEEPAGGVANQTTLPENGDIPVVVLPDGDATAGDAAADAAVTAPAPLKAPAKAPAAPAADNTPAGDTTDTTADPDKDAEAEEKESHTTVYKGVDYAAVYDYDYYKANNPDVVAATGGDDAKMLEHFVECGMKEGRQGSENFDVFSYKNAYGDLRQAFGKNLASYYKHYINNGQKEGRDQTTGVTELQNPVTKLNGIDYSAVYDYNYYVNKYPDIAKAYPNDDVAVLKHFVACGMKERRSGNETFDVRSYRNEYADLRQAFGKNWPAYYKHYITNGQKEGRITSGVDELQNPVHVYNGKDVSAVYDYDYYTAHNPDVVKAYGDDDVAILKHFMLCGMKEQRQGNADFEPKSYRYANPDLRVAFVTNYPAYYQHYIDYGKKEGRVATGVTELQNPVTKLNGVDYSAVYDYDYYTSKYPDMKAVYKDNDVAILNHFITSGMKEQRQGIASFDEVSYRHQWQDLRRAFGSDYPKYYEHYMKSGKKEGRKATGVPTLQNPITDYKGTDLSAIFDYYYYRDHNPDVVKKLGDNDTALIQHFVVHGLVEGRKGKATYDKNVYAQMKEKFHPSDPFIAKAQGYSSATSWLMLVDLSRRRVGIFHGSQGNWTMVKNFICSIGAPGTPTITGIYTVGIKELYFGNAYYRCWYATQILGDYLFHSVTYYPASGPYVIQEGAMGVAISHGCVRLQLENAKWIYDNIPSGTKISIY